MGRKLQVTSGYHRPKADTLAQCWLRHPALLAVSPWRSLAISLYQASVLNEGVAEVRPVP